MREIDHRIMPKITASPMLSSTRFRDGAAKAAGG